MLVDCNASDFLFVFSSSFSREMSLCGTGPVSPPDSDRKAFRADCFARVVRDIATLSHLASRRCSVEAKRRPTFSGSSACPLAASDCENTDITVCVEWSGGSARRVQCRWSRCVTALQRQTSSLGPLREMRAGPRLVSGGPEQRKSTKTFSLPKLASTLETRARVARAKGKKGEHERETSESKVKSNKVISWSATYSKDICTSGGFAVAF